jgi:hypothetical protein
MYHNMKTFSELQAIDWRIRVSVRLEPDFDVYPPWVQLKVNDTIEENYLRTAQVRNFDLPLLHPVEISILVRQDRETHDPRRGVTISSIEIDDRELMPEFCYLADLSENLKCFAPTNHIVQDGQWCFHITKPFYQWYHTASDQGWLLEP